MSKLGIIRFDEISKLEILFWSSCLCSLLAVSVLYFEKKLGIGFVNIRKFVNSRVPLIQHISNSFSYEKPRTLVKTKMEISSNFVTLSEHIDLIVHNELLFITFRFGASTWSKSSCSKRFHWSQPMARGWKSPPTVCILVSVSTLTT